MNWSKLTAGPHAGETMPEVMLRDPDYVLAGMEQGVFSGTLLDEAQEVCRRATRIVVPPVENDDRRDAVVFYCLHPNGDFGGFTIVKRSHPRFQDYAKFSAAQARYFDLTLPRRLASADPKASSTMLGGIMWQFFGETAPNLGADECIAFFNDPEFIMPESEAEQGA